MKEGKSENRRWLIPLAALVLTLFLFQTVLFVGYVPTASMEPALKAGSYILGTRLADHLQTGDVIVFWYNGRLLVKRIAARPGDRIDRRELVYMSSTPIPVWEDPILMVPEGCYFVLGDNSENSVDSRYWDEPFVRECDIVAKIFMD